MAISKKGLRKITVDGQEYYWKFRGVVKVYREQGTFAQLSVDFGWFDKWLYIGDPPNEHPPDFSPETITPKFVAEAIRYARGRGWTEGQMGLDFKDGSFSLSS